MVTAISSRLNIASHARVRSLKGRKSAPEAILLRQKSERTPAKARSNAEGDRGISFALPGLVLPGALQRTRCSGFLIRCYQHQDGTFHVRAHYFKTGSVQRCGFPGCDRYVRVYPPSEKPGNKPFPVLYMFDGQNIFHDDPSYCGGWYLHHAVKKLIDKGETAPLIVGIDHGGASRVHELSPFTGNGCHGPPRICSHGSPASLSRASKGVPRARQHGGDGHRRLVPGRARGALRPLSPPGGVRRGALHVAVVMARRREDLRLDCGRSAAVGRRGSISTPASREETARSSRNVERLVQHLRERGYDDSALCWHADDEGTHSEGAWRKRAPKALQFLFLGTPGKKPIALDRGLGLGLGLKERVALRQARDRGRQRIRLYRLREVHLKPRLERVRRVLRRRVRRQRDGRERGHLRAERADASNQP